MDELLQLSLKRAELIDSLIEEVLSRKHVDCSRGCVYCCYGVTLWGNIFEVVHIISILNSYPLKDRKLIAGRLRGYMKEYSSAVERLGLKNPYGPLHMQFVDSEMMGRVGGIFLNEVPCPFLNTQGGECTVYPARPLMCRLTAFRDRNLCRRDWENPLALIWSKDILPFLEEIKGEFFPRWKVRALELGLGERESTLYLIPGVITFNPVKKVFFFREPRSP
jgi:Fe-S-cluster containining protein